MTASIRNSNGNPSRPNSALTRRCDTCDTWDGNTGQVRQASTERGGYEPDSITVEAKLVYSVTETADQLGIGRTMVYELIRTGSLPSLKIGERRLVARADLEAFVDALREGAA